jgi:hypothetical protein
MKIGAPPFGTRDPQGAAVEYRQVPGRQVIWRGVKVLTTSAKCRRWHDGRGRGQLGSLVLIVEHRHQQVQRELEAVRPRRLRRRNRGCDRRAAHRRLDQRRRPGPASAAEAERLGGLGGQGVNRHASDRGVSVMQSLLIGAMAGEVEARVSSPSAALRGVRDSNTSPPWT